MAGWCDSGSRPGGGLRPRRTTRGDWTIDPEATRPFAAGAAVLEAADPSSGEPARLKGSVVIDQDPDMALAWPGITCAGPDGRRSIVDGLSFATTSFNGTAWDWPTAAFAGR